MDNKNIACDSGALKNLFSGMRLLEVSEYFILAAAIAIFPISWHIALWFMVLFVVNAVARMITYRTCGNDHSSLVRWIYALLPLFYFVYLTSMLYTSNTACGWNSLAQMISAVLIPIYFLFARPAFLTRKRMRLLGYFFAITTTIISLIYMGLFVQRVVISHEPLQTMFDDTSIIEHRIYYSMYTVFAMAFLYLEMRNHGRQMAIWWRVLAIVGVAVLCAVTLILSSRIGILCMGVLILCALVDIVFVQKHWVIGVVLAVAVAAVAISNAGMMELVRFRFTNTIQSLYNPLQDDRFGIWKNAIMVIGDNPVLGVGVGDMMEDLESNRRQYFSQYEGTAWEWTNRNPHNQYLDTWVSVGAIGLAVLIAIIVMPLIVFFRTKPRQWMLLLFLFITASTFLVEAILERQMGVLFFVFGYCLLLNISKNKERITTNSGERE